MIKKMLIIFIILLWVIWNVFAEWEKQMYITAQETIKMLDDQIASHEEYVDSLIEQWESADKIAEEEAYIYDLQTEANELENSLPELESNYKNSEDYTKISEAWFSISVNETIWVWFKVEWDTSQVINRTLWTIIQKLMIALWVLAVLIMTVWAGYIIMYHGQDELLSKGKSIFMSGITALVVALSSYYLVSILRYILYN